MEHPQGGTHPWLPGEKKYMVLILKARLLTKALGG